MYVDPFCDLGEFLRLNCFSHEARLCFHTTYKRSLEKALFQKVQPISLLWSMARWESTVGFSIVLSCCSDARLFLADLAESANTGPIVKAESLCDLSEIVAIAEHARLIATEMQDRIVTTSHLVLGLSMINDTKISELFSKHSVLQAKLAKLVHGAVEALELTHCDIVNVNFFKNESPLMVPFTDDVVLMINQMIDRCRSRKLLGTIPSIMLLWSILRWEKKLALAILEQCSVQLSSLEEDVRRQLDALTDMPNQSVVDLRFIEEIANSAREEASLLEKKYVGTEHILLAMLKQETGIRELLNRHGATYDTYKAILLKRSS